MALLELKKSTLNVASEKPRFEIEFVPTKQTRNGLAECKITKSKSTTHNVVGQLIYFLPTDQAIVDKKCQAYVAERTVFSSDRKQSQREEYVRPDTALVADLQRAGVSMSSYSKKVMGSSLDQNIIMQIKQEQALGVNRPRTALPTPTGASAQVQSIFTKIV
jgi:hypothetical protein